MGKFQKGHPKPPNSGRKKGVKNKRKLLSVEDFFVERGIHPLDLLFRYVEEISNPTDKAKIMLELLQYWAPKYKATVPSEEDDETIEADYKPASAMTPEERLKLIRGSSNGPTSQG